jgi:hypothetical protein
MSHGKMLSNFLTKSQNPAASLKDALSLKKDLNSKNFFTYVLSCDALLSFAFKGVHGSHALKEQNLVIDGLVGKFQNFLSTATPDERRECIAELKGKEGMISTGPFLDKVSNLLSPASSAEHHKTASVFTRPRGGSPDAEASAGAGHE